MTSKNIMILAGVGFFWLLLKQQKTATRPSTTARYVPQNINTNAAANSISNALVAIFGGGKTVTTAPWGGAKPTVAQATAAQAAAQSDTDPALNGSVADDSYVINVPGNTDAYGAITAQYTASGW